MASNFKKLAACVMRAETIHDKAVDLAALVREVVAEHDMSNTDNLHCFANEVVTELKALLEEARSRSMTKKTP